MIQQNQIKTLKKDKVIQDSVTYEKKLDIDKGIEVAAPKVIDENFLAGAGCLLAREHL